MTDTKLTPEVLAEGKRLLCGWLVSDCAQLKAERDDLRTELKELKDAQQEFMELGSPLHEVAIKTLASERDALRTRVAELEEQVSDMTNRMAANVEELTYGEVVSLRTDNATLKDKVAELESQLHTCPKCGESCIDCQCVAERVAGLEADVARLTKLNQLELDAARTIGHPEGNSAGDIAVVVGAELARLRTMLAGAKVQVKSQPRKGPLRYGQKPDSLWWGWFVGDEYIGDLDDALFAIGRDAEKD
jgi:uncharacterized protein YdcH (DUF465 family)